MSEPTRLVTTGDLNRGQDNALIAKLERGNIETAINQLAAFVNQVTGLIATDVLPPEEGQPLIEAANGIIAALGG